MLVPALWSCQPADPDGTEPPPSSGRTIVLAHASTMGNLRGLMDEFEARFEASHPGVDVRQVVMDDDDYQKFGLLNLFTGSTSPDVYFQWGGFLVERDARAGFARDLTPLLERDGLRSRFRPERWFGSSFDGGEYFLPHTVEVSVVLFYNRRIFRELSLEPPRTWPQLLAACRTIRAAGITPIVAGNKDLWMVGNWASHIASRVVGEDEYHATLSLQRDHRFDSTPWIEALGRLAELVELRAFNPGVVSMTDAEAKVEFITGRAAMTPNGSWLVTDIVKARETGESIDYSFLNTPSIPGGRGDQQSVMAVCNGYVMGKRTRDPELTWEFMKAFFDPETQRDWVGEGYISPVIGAGNPLREVEEIIDLLGNADRTVSPPDTGYAPAAWQALYDAIQQVLAGNRSPTEALDEAERYVRVFGART